LLYNLSSICNEGSKISKKLWKICEKRASKENDILEPVVKNILKNNHMIDMAKRGKL
jgi:hypothetical protein